MSFSLNNILSYYFITKKSLSRTKIKAKHSNYSLKRLDSSLHDLRQNYFHLSLTIEDFKNFHIEIYKVKLKKEKMWI